jgi:methylenetetrahydrofolate reductase (NADH)
MASREELIALVDGYSIETTPATAAKVDSFKALLPAGTRVNVTFLPGTDYNDTVATAERLRREGMVPVPHIAARSIPSKAALETYLGRLRDEAGVEEALVIGGGVTTPLGPFDASMQLLETGLFRQFGIRRVGIAGHPEGTPDIAPDEVRKATLAKARWALDTGIDMYLITQFCFEAAPVIRWIHDLRGAGIHLPVRIGVPGPASIKTLLRYAQECGIGPSMRVITRQAKNVAKLLTVQAPDALLAGLAEFKASDPSDQLAGIHLYAFGGFAKTCHWFNAVRSGTFDLARNGKGFTLPQPPAQAAG